MKKFLIIQLLIILFTVTITSIICNQIYKNKLNEIKTDIDIHYKKAFIYRKERATNLEFFINTVEENLKDDKYFMELFNHNIKVIDDLIQYNMKKLNPVPVSYRSEDAKQFILEDATLFYCIPRYYESKACQVIMNTLYAN